MRSNLRIGKYILRTSHGDCARYSPQGFGFERVRSQIYQARKGAAGSINADEAVRRSAKARENQEVQRPRWRAPEAKEAVRAQMAGIYGG